LAVYTPPRITAQTTHEQLLNIVAMLVKDLEFILNGAIDSKNVREIGGYRVDQTALQSKDGAVGMSSASTADDDLRIWAGSAERAIAAFKVFESGLVTMTKFLLSSGDGTFPKIEMGSEGNLFAAFYNEDTYIAIEPNYGNAPSLNFVVGGEVKARINNLLGFEIVANGGMRLQAPTGGIEIDVAETMQFSSMRKISDRSMGNTLYDQLAELADRIEALEEAIRRP